MRRLCGLLALALALGVLATAAVGPADAQDKAKTKKAKEPEKKSGKAAALGTIEIYKAKDGFRYRIKDGEGKTIAMPARGQDSRAEVLKDLEEIKTILAKARPADVAD